MGIIIKQSLKGSLWSYLGVIVGFITTAYFYPNFLTTDVVGLFSLLIAYSTLFGQFSLLGIHGVTSRLFPYFRDKKSGHHGFLFISLSFMAAGFSVFLILYFSLAPLLIKTNLERSKLFADYIYLLIPLTLFSMIFIFFDTYKKVLYNAVIGIILQDFFQRLLILIVTLLYIFHYFDLNQLIIGYAIVVCLKGIMLLLFLFASGDLDFRPDSGFITKKLKKEIVSVASYSILSGLGSMIVFSIDKIVVNQMIDLSNTGIYTIAFYFGTLVIIPSRPLLKISGTLIADAWARNDLAQIKNIYHKSCINQFIIGGFLFLGIWANIGNILTILGPDYQPSKWVIFFIGVGYLFDMMTGANAQIIAFSNQYRIALLFTVILIVLVVGLLYFLIPLWGITGAAVAMAMALLLNNAMRYLFLLRKFRLQPFNLKFIWITVFYASVLFLISLIPQRELYTDLFLRSILIVIFTVSFFWIIPLSEDITMIKNASVLYLQKKLK